MILNRPFKRTVAATMFAAIVCASNGKLLRAGQPYVVSESVGGRIWRIHDSNNDGDALDVGERTLWGDGFTGAQGMTADSLAVYVTEEGLADGSNQVVRLLDANSDGDALDVGERTVWLDGLDDPRDISFGAGGISYLSEFDNNQIWRLVDSNNDGDALDNGERILFADGIIGPQMILPQAGTLLVAAEVGDQIHRLVDRNGDGDALDVAENLVITPMYDQPVGLLLDGGGGFYFTSLSTDTVYHARDQNADGDMLDVAEARTYADFVYGLLNGPAGLTAFDGGGFLLADSLQDQLKLVRDTNGDGDALDLGDVLLFADGIDQPIDILALPPVLPGDFNHDETVDAADYVVWRNNPNRTQAQYELWRANFGQPNGSGAGATVDESSAAVPEPTSLVLLVLATVFLFAVRK